MISSASQEKAPKFLKKKMIIQAEGGVTGKGEQIY